MPTMLDDLWGHMYAMGPHLRKFIAGVMDLNMVPKDAVEKGTKGRELDVQLRNVDQKITRFMNSSLCSPDDSVSTRLLYR
jgi:hypothetical protein